MAAILTENRVTPGASTIGSSDPLVSPSRDRAEQLAAELGIWLASIERFSSGVHPHNLVHGHGDKGQSIVSEFRILRSALLRSTRIAITLLISVRNLSNQQFIWASKDQIEKVVAALQDASITANALAAHEVSSGVWHSHRRTLITALSAARVDHFTRAADESGEGYLPSPFLNQLNGGRDSDGELAMLRSLMPRFGRVLKWLSIVGDMLRRDEPLKPCVLIFSHVDWQLSELTRIIDEQLSTRSRVESDILAALDAASYTAAVELKKVRSKELPGLLHLDSATSVFARIETAYSLLNDSLQQIVATFAQALNQNSSVFALFPEFEVKRRNSIRLRSDLWVLTRAVRSAEVCPKAVELANLNTHINEFVSGSARFLFYKDTESVERFIEEISLTREQVDIVPLLHRFGAFLETLLGQVNLRIVLQDQPFEPPESVDLLRA